MKKLLAVLIISLLPLPLLAAGYLNFSYGSGGESDATSFGLEMGGIVLSNLHPTGGALCGGFGVSVADTKQSVPANLPHTGQNLIWLQDYNDNNQSQISLMGGAELVPSIFAVLGLGYTTQKIAQLGFSNNAYYLIRNRTEHETPWMAGVRYTREMLNLGIGYDVQRGIVMSAGVAF